MPSSLPPSPATTGAPVRPSAPSARAREWRSRPGPPAPCRSTPSTARPEIASTSPATAPEGKDATLNRHVRLGLPQNIAMHKSGQGKLFGPFTWTLGRRGRARRHLPRESMAIAQRHSAVANGARWPKGPRGSEASSRRGFHPGDHRSTVGPPALAAAARPRASLKPVISARPASHIEMNSTPKRPARGEAEPSRENNSGPAPSTTGSAAVLRNGSAHPTGRRLAV